MYFSGTLTSQILHQYITVTFVTLNHDVIVHAVQHLPEHVNTYDTNVLERWNVSSKQRQIFVLDLYNYNDSKTEINLCKAYTVAET